MIRQDYSDDEYLRGFIVKMFILLLEIVDFLLQQLDIEAPQFKRRRILNVVGVDVKKVRFHLKIKRNEKEEYFFWKFSIGSLEIK